MALAVNAAGAPTGEGGQVMPISDFYGYIIDLAFRTNAAESNLLLQQTAVDRIYEGSTGTELNEESTMGHGATMTFTATEAGFTTEQMKELMKAIRIVFFVPAEGDGANTIVATAKLDVANATVTGGTTVTATIYLYTMTAGGGYVTATYDPAATGETYFTRTVSYVECAEPATAGVQLYVKNAEGGYDPASYAEDSTETYYTQSISHTKCDDPANVGEGVQLYVIQKAGEVRKTDNVIMPLIQNQAAKLSVLVYLDGNAVGNEDVAYSGTTSMTGTMNLQFSSSATLVPMEYTPLMPQGVPATTEGNG